MIYKFTILFLLSSPAFAYTDPGSGMLLIQGLIAALAMGAAFIKNPIKTIKLLMQLRKNNGNDQEHSNPPLDSQSDPGNNSETEFSKEKK